MADDSSASTPAASTAHAPSFALQTAQSQFTQLLGVLVQNTSSQSGDQSSALTAILSAIQAKPAA